MGEGGQTETEASDSTFQCIEYFVSPAIGAGRDLARKLATITSKYKAAQAVLNGRHAVIYAPHKRPFLTQPHGRMIRLWSRHTYPISIGPN